MFIEFPAVDYLRLSSFDGKTIAAFHKVVLRRNEPNTDASWKQYKGIRAGQLFAGVAKQNEKIHGILDVSGPDAHAIVFAENPAGLDVKSTRIDLQVTIPLLPEYRYRAREFKDMLETADWSTAQGARLHKRKATLIEGPSEFGLDTVYIGSRTTDRFSRVYVKEDSESNQYLRFEVEFKSKRANLAYQECLTDGRNLAAILRGEWERIPPVEVEAWQKIGELLASFQDGKQISIPRTAADANSRFRWLTTNVMPALDTLLNDHEYGWRARRALEDLLNKHNSPTGQNQNYGGSSWQAFKLSTQF